MKIEQIYTGCLAQGAYYIESDGEVAIIDPLREVDSYIGKARRDNARIKYVFETHFHADFVSGHLDLSNKTGAEIIYGPSANPSFPVTLAHDMQQFQLGGVTIQVIHTPGHTIESSCYLVKDESGVNKALFTGDTLFIGDVGRPDLAQKRGSLTREDLARMLYTSLREKIMPLEDNLVIYPAHGAGSACGKKMSMVMEGTLGEQKQTNYALRANMTETEFVTEVTDGLLPPPGYFPLNVHLNRVGYESMDTVMERGNHALTPEDFENQAEETGALILDTREASDFARDFIPGAINIGIDGSFAPWVGEMIPDIMHPILLIAPEGREQEVITRLARVGYDHTIGYLEGGIASWRQAGKETDSIQRVDMTELAGFQDAKDLRFIDVRKESEFSDGHLENAKNIPLASINEAMSIIDPDEPYIVHCAGGYRSMIFVSTLRSRGFYNLVDVKGGYKAIMDSGLFNLSEMATANLL